MPIRTLCYPSLCLLAVVCSLLLGCGGSDDDANGVSNGNSNGDANGNSNGNAYTDDLIEETFVTIDCGITGSHAATEIWGDSETFGLGEGGLSEKVGNAHRFRELYLALNPNSQDEPPEIDFHEQQVLALGYGVAPNLRYEMELERVAGDDTRVRVDYLTVIPGLECVSEDAEGYPYCLVAIEATEREVEFVAREEVRDCD